MNSEINLKDNNFKNLEDRNYDLLTKFSSLQKDYSNVTTKKEIIINENKLLDHRLDEHKNIIHVLESEIEKEKSLKMQEIKLNHELRLREAESMETETLLVKEKENLLSRNEDLYNMVKKFEDDNMKQSEAAFLRSKEIEAYKSELSKSEYENEKLKFESNNHKDMINLLTVNKEREISDINNFYNTTVQEHSKLLNKVETDQKDMIGN